MEKEKETKEYPVRYEAFNKEGIVWINEQPKRKGGNEWVVYHYSKPSKRYPNLKNSLYCEVVSFQEEGLLLDCRVENRDKRKTNGLSKRLAYTDLKIAIDLIQAFIKENIKIVS